MKLKQKFYDHGQVDVTAILSVIPNITNEKWYEWPLRKEATIPFLYMPNFTDPTDFSKIEKFNQPAWLEEAVYPLAEDLEKKFKGKILKLMLIAVEPEDLNGRLHVDPSKTLQLVHRCHMPLIQSDRTKYHVGGTEFPLEVGHWYEKDNTLMHTVFNYANPRERRVSLQCDVLPLDDSRFDLLPDLYPR
jgi:hypothetical protein